MEHFYAAEDRNGVRFSWHYWPSTSVDCKKLMAPLACMYTPLKMIENMPMVKYDPVTCTNSNCTSHLNPFCQVDLNAHIWVCPFCFQRNRFPSHYDGISQTNIPLELHPTATTIEYTLSAPEGVPPAFVFVVDISLPEDVLESLKGVLLQCITEIPDTAYVGLITYGQQVNVYELGFSYCPKMHVFEGSVEVTAETVQKMLGLGAPAPGGKIQASIANRYIMPLSKVEFTLTSILEELFPDPRPTRSDQRKQRATGVAVQVALNMLEYTFAYSGARVLVFGGGPATFGPGLVVSEDKKESIRSHTELNKEKASHVFQATKLYTTLAEQAAKNGHAVDIFSCSLDQTGILEMKELPKMTGGIIVTAETFNHDQFKKSLKKLFEKDADNFLKMGFNGKLEIKTSKELSISGAIGHMTSGFNKNGTFSDPEIGIGRTCEWKMAVMDPSSSYAIFFDINSEQKSANSGKYGMIQFKTRYTHPSGKRILRVTTVAHNWMPAGAQPSELLVGFDQEACAALVTRLAVYKNDTEDINVVGWIDKHLIRFTRRYANYQRDSEHTFQLPAAIGLYPQFMFHLRRGCLVNVFGCSPDETVYYRHYLQREPIGNILIMIQPSLDSYAIGNDEPSPVLLAASTLKNDVILVLDTFFHVVIWIGTNISGWREAKYHEQPEYSNLKQLLEVPVEDARAIAASRFPMPLYVECDQNTSQSRFLLAVVDPGQVSAFGGETVNTEDASLQRFMDHLKKAAVQAE